MFRFWIILLYSFISFYHGRSLVNWIEKMEENRGKEKERKRTEKKEGVFNIFIVLLF